MKTLILGHEIKPVFEGDLRVKQCPECGRYFIPGDKGEKQKFCSRACGPGGRARVRIIPKTCPICKIWMAQPETSKRKTCSRECGGKLAWHVRHGRPTPYMVEKVWQVTDIEGGVMDEFETEKMANEYRDKLNAKS